MTSILTNTSAMNALQTLKNTNLSLNKTQQEIASGKSIASARDNAAVWAISKVMDSDVKGFEQISNSLALGQSTMAVARNASESITDLLTDIKGLVVSAQEENVDRAKINTDISRLREQVESIIGAAQFNGLNLIDGSAGTEVNLLSSLNRSATGPVTAANITIDTDTTNLSLAAGSAVTLAAALGTITATAGTTNTAITASGFNFYTADFAATTGTVALNSGDFTGGTEGFTGLVVGDRVTMTFGDGTADLETEVSYTIREGDTGTSILAGLMSELEEAGIDQDVGVSFDGASLLVDNQLADDFTISFTASRGEGGLSALTSIDVSDSAGADAALVEIERMIDYSINAAASLGSAEKRIDIQAGFVSKLVDSFKAGIGTLVDADMEEASARLQALQVQQQLGVQALSIANQSPQTLLSLFR